MMNIRIYQINTSRDTENVIFLSFDEMKDKTGKIRSENYDKVFEGNVDKAFEYLTLGDFKAKDLQDIHRMFNIAKPAEYDGRSLRVSDVVEVVESDTVEPGFYYCDAVFYGIFSADYKKISFEPEAATNCCNKQTIPVAIVEPGKKGKR